MKFNSIVKTAIVLLIVSFSFIACDKEIHLHPSHASTQHIFNKAQNLAAESRNSEEESDCFNFVFPITVLLPDGDRIPTKDIEELAEILEDWVENNEEEEAFPTFQFPIKVNLQGQIKSIEDEEQLDEHLESCEQTEAIEVADTTLPPTSENTISILPLGDSRVEGARPNFESYRFELWKNLIANNWSIDFVGTRVDEGNYNRFIGQDFDRDHEGTGGATTDDILATLERIRTDNPPAVVLLGIGGNDLTDGQQTVERTIGNINRIIDDLQSRNPNVTIFLEQIAPGHSSFMTNIFIQTLRQFNARIAALSQEQTTNTSEIIIVNMEEGWSDEYLADEVHYNEKGAKIIADKYFAAFNEYYNKENN